MIVIVLDLLCGAGHRFEGWFGSNEDFEKQSATHMLSCPVCGEPRVSRLPSAPYVQRTDTSQAVAREQHAGMIEKLRALANDSEDVGTKLPDEARRIHSGEAEARPIRGMASVRDVLGLLEEGITVLPLPGPKEDLH